MPGPAPSANRRRRNAPTIPGVVLPAGGRVRPAPNVPDGYALGDAGLAWWAWAWRLPQAERWDDGVAYVAARRAQLEDHLAAVKLCDELDLRDLLAGADPEATRRVDWALQMLKRSASGCVGLMKEMRELDKRLGLDPKALVELRWTIGEVEQDQPVASSPVRTLRAVDAVS